jgi:hypothetical protein
MRRLIFGSTLLTTTLLLSTAALICEDSHASGASIKPQRGRLLNHSEIPSEDLAVLVEWTCLKGDPEQNPEFCGGARVPGTVRSDGVFDTPEIELEGKGDFYISFQVGTKDTMARQEKQGLFSRNFYYGTDYSRMPTELANISVLEAPPRELDFQLASGTPGANWVKTNGRETRVSARLDFAGDRKVSAWDTDYALTQAVGNSYPRRLFFIPSDTGQPPQVVATVGAINEALFLTNGGLFFSKRFSSQDFNGRYPSGLTHIPVNDANHPVLDRSLAGEWDGWLHAGSPERVLDFRADFDCEEGVLSGTLTLSSRGASREIVDVNGRCAYGTAEIRFRSRALMNTTTSEDYVAHVGDVVYDARIAKWAGPRGAAFTPIQNASGQHVGDFQAAFRARELPSSRALELFVGAR